MARELGVLCALVAACNGTQGPTPQPARGGSAMPAGGADDTAHTEDTEAPAFRVSVTPPSSCARRQPCEARIVLTALDPFKVNEEYPFKFVADENALVEFEGTGTFARTDPKSATHTIAFRADATGTVKVSGRFKLSVCTDATCKIEASKIAFQVAIRE